MTLKYTGPIPFAATGMRYYRREKNKCPRRTYHWPYGRRLFGVVVFFIFILNLLIVIFRILRDRQIYALEIKKNSIASDAKKTLFLLKTRLISATSIIALRGLNLTNCLVSFSITLNKKNYNNFPRE